MTSDFSYFNETDKGVPNLQYNPNSWTLTHNMLYVEQPKVASCLHY